MEGSNAFQIIQMGLLNLAAICLAGIWHRYLNSLDEMEMIPMRSENGFLQRPTIHEGLLYDKVENEVVCSLCERHCQIMADQKGFCRTRINYNNKLYTIVYGDISAINSRPIEIKPFFHFYPRIKADHNC